MPYERRWLTILETSARLGISPKTVSNRLARRELPVSYALGPRSPRIDWRELEERLERGRPKKGELSGADK